MNISVIVPVYNTAPYLDRCVESLTGQTLENLEILLVDDGSTDGSGAMCDAWALRDSRVRVLHRKNGGLGSARNAGLFMAKGSWISFVDSDDWVETSFLETLLDTAIRMDVPLSCCGYGKSDREAPLGKAMPDIQLLSRETAMLDVIEDRRTGVVVWNKLYARRLLEGLSFPENRLHEDEYFTHLAVGRADRVAYADTVLYRYRQRPDSIMGAAFSLKRLDAAEAKAARLRYLRETMPGLVFPGKKSLFFTCLCLGQLSLRSLDRPERRQAAAYLTRTVQENQFTRTELRQLKPTHRFWVFLSRISLGLTCRIRNLLNIGL